VFREWKKDWKAFQKAPPGERFRRSYRDHKTESRLWARVATVALGLGLIVVGAIMLVIPGPGLLAVGLGGALIAREFRWAATALDWAEVTLRKGFRLGMRFWKSASVAVRSVVVVIGAAVAAGAAYVAWTWLIRF
jgi:hypothetical protein